jgi:hypothetical protein
VEKVMKKGKKKHTLTGAMLLEVVIGAFLVGLSICGLLVLWQGQKLLTKTFIY